MSLGGVWNSPSSSWWVKASRAGEHLDRLRREVDEFRASEPYSVTPEPTDNPNVTAYRLRYHRDVPPALSATVGDVVHNLRAALENLAFEVARQDQGGTLSPKQEWASTFPIRKSPEDFDRFIAAKARKTLRYTSLAQKAFRSVQPFVILEGAQRLGISLDETYEEAFRWNVLHRLDAVWNIDKHRRLTFFGRPRLWPDMIWWTSNGPSNRRALPGDGTLADNSILLYIEGSDEGQGSELNYEFNLVLTDDPAYASDGTGATEDVVSLLTSWHRAVVHVFHQVPMIMSNDAGE